MADDAGARGRGWRGLAAPALCYAALRAWGTLAVGMHPLFKGSPDAASLAPVAIGAYFFARLAVDVAFLWRPPRGSGPLPVAGCAAMVAGCAAVFLAGNGLAGGLALFVAGAVACGAGLEALTLLLVGEVSRLPVGDIGAVVAAGAAMEAACSALYFAPSAAALGLCLALPFAAVASAPRVRRACEARASTLPKRDGLPPRAAVAPVAVGVAMLFFGAHFLQNGLFGSVLQVGGGLGGPDGWAWAAIAGRWGSVLVTLALLGQVRFYRFDTAFAVVAILAIVAFLMLPLGLDGSLLMFSVLSIAACCAATNVAVMMAAFFAGYVDARSLQVAGGGFAAMHAGHSLGVVVSTAISVLLPRVGADGGAAGVSAVAVVLLAVSGIWLLRERNVTILLWGTGSAGAGLAGAGAAGGGVGLPGACAKAAMERGLTAREAQVLGLLAQGRSVPFIAELLLVSQSTVKTHIKHIYAKLGVHSRQELISLLRGGE